MANSTAIIAVETTTTIPASSGFAHRHIGPSPSDVAAMLRTVGTDSLDALIAETVPASILDPGQLTFGPALTETETIAYLRTVAAKNQVLTSLIGQGYYGTVVPAVIQRNILENPPGTPPTRHISRRSAKAG